MESTKSYKYLSLFPFFCLSVCTGFTCVRATENNVIQGIESVNFDQIGNVFDSYQANVVNQLNLRRVFYVAVRYLSYERMGTNAYYCRKAIVDFLAGECRRYGYNLDFHFSLGNLRPNRGTYTVFQHFVLDANLMGIHHSLPFFNATYAMPVLPNVLHYLTGSDTRMMTNEQKSRVFQLLATSLNRLDMEFMALSLYNNRTPFERSIDNNNRAMSLLLTYYGLSYNSLGVLVLVVPLHIYSPNRVRLHNSCRAFVFFLDAYARECTLGVIPMDLIDVIGKFCFGDGSRRLYLRYGRGTGGRNARYFEDF